MLTFQSVGEFLSAESFRPFRLHMASGRTFDVKHPEMILVGRTSANVYMRPDGDETQPEKWQKISLMLLESIEPLEIQSAAGSI